MVLAAETVRRRAIARRADRVHEHGRGVQRRRRPRLRAPRRRRRLRDRARADEPRGLARLPRLGLLLRRRRRAARATRSRSTRAGATAAPSTRSTRRATCSTASTACARSGARGSARGTRCSSPPDIVASRLVADSGWPVTIPDRAEITLAALILPHQADADGWTERRPAGDRGLPAALVRRRPVARRAPAALHLAHPGQPVRDAHRRGERPGAARRQRGARPAGDARRARLLVRRRHVLARGAARRR